MLFRSLKLWDAQSGALLRTLAGHSDGVTSCAFSPDGRWLLSASYDSTLKLWDAQSGKCLATFQADAGLVCCVMHGEFIVVGGTKGVYWLKLMA